MLRALGILAIFVGTVFTTSPTFAQDKADTAKKADEKKADEKKGDEEGERRTRRRGRGGPFGGGDFAKNATEFLTKELDLDEGQQKKVRAIMEEMMASMMQRMMERFSSGGGMRDPGMRDEARKAMEDMRVELGKKISKVLTPAQRREFEVLVEQFDQRAQRWESRREANQDPSQLFNPKPQSKRLLLDKAQRTLFLSEEETEALRPMVSKLVESRVNLYEGRKARRKDLLNAIQSGAKPDEIKERMETIRAAEQFQRLEVLAAQQQLRDYLSLEQEARFVAMGLLD